MDPTQVIVERRTDEIFERRTLEKGYSQPLSQPTEAPKKLRLEDVYPIVKDPFIIHHISEVKQPQLKEAELTERDPESEVLNNKLNNIYSFSYTLKVDGMEKRISTFT